MSITRRTALAGLPLPIAANAIIAAGDFVCVNSSGYAVPGADASGLRFMGVASRGATGDNGITSAIALANALQITMNTHAADATEHKIADATNFPVDTDPCVDETTLLALTGELLTAYAAHNADAILASPVIHQAQDTTHALVSAVTPTTVAEAITRLNDLKTKYNLHDAETTAHDVGNKYQEDQAAAAAVDGVTSVPIFSTGQFKMTAVSITQAMVGDSMVMTDHDTFDDTSTNKTVVGKLVKYVSATSGWVDINPPGIVAAVS